MALDGTMLLVTARLPRNDRDIKKGNNMYDNIQWGWETTFKKSTASDVHTHTYLRMHNTAREPKNPVYV